MHYLESRLLGAVLGEQLRAAAFILYWRRTEARPDFGAISRETGISLESLGVAWEIVRTECVDQSSAVEAR